MKPGELLNHEEHEATQDLCAFASTLRLGVKKTFTSRVLAERAENAESTNVKRETANFKL
jgi:hypothetical protein